MNPACTNPACSSNSLCPCDMFLKDLFNLTQDIYSDTHEQQWKQLELYTKQCSCQYTKQCSCQNPKMISNTDHRLPVRCSHQLCILILERQEFYRQNGADLSIVLVNCLSYIYWRKPFVSNCNYFLKHLVMEACLEEENEILRVLMGLEGRTYFMKMLVNLDLVTSTRFDDDLFVSDFIITNLRHIRILISSTLAPEEDVINILKVVFFRAKYDGCFKRIYLVTIAIKAIQFKIRDQENKAEKYIHCLRMYFAATRDLFLTMNEVRSTLYTCLFLHDKLQLFESHYEEFVKLMPECPVSVEPRSLVHLARCQVRTNIKKCNLPLPPTVEKLSVPGLIKRFVLCDEIDETRNPRNVSSEQVITRSQLDKLMYKDDTWRLLEQYKV